MAHNVQKRSRRSVEGCINEDTYRGEEKPEADKDRQGGWPVILN